MAIIGGGRSAQSSGADLRRFLKTGFTIAFKKWAALAGGALGVVLVYVRLALGVGRTEFGKLLRLGQFVATRTRTRVLRVRVILFLVAFTSGISGGCTLSASLVGKVASPGGAAQSNESPRSRLHRATAGTESLRLSRVDSAVLRRKGEGAGRGGGQKRVCLAASRSIAPIGLIKSRPGQDFVEPGAEVIGILIRLLQTAHDCVRMESIGWLGMQGATDRAYIRAWPPGQLDYIIICATPSPLRTLR